MVVAAAGFGAELDAVGVVLVSGPPDTDVVVAGKVAARTLDRELLEAVVVVHLRVNARSRSLDRILYRKWCVSLEASNAYRFCVLHT